MKPKNPKLIQDVALKNLSRHPDDRGYFEELIRITDPFFKEGFGQLSHSFMNKNVIKAWHIHKTQIDWWFVAHGDLLVALYDNRKNSPTYRVTNIFKLGEHFDSVILKIPAGVAHGCKVISSTSELFYVTSSIYNPLEEGRIPPGDSTIGFDWNKDI